MGLISSHVTFVFVVGICFCSGCIGFKDTQKTEFIHSSVFRNADKNAILVPIWLFNMDGPNRVHVEKIDGNYQTVNRYFARTPSYLNSLCTSRLVKNKQVDVVCYAANFDPTALDWKSSQYFDLQKRNERVEVSLPFLEGKSLPVFSTNQVPVGYSHYFTVNDNFTKKGPTTGGFYGLLAGCTFLMLPLVRTEQHTVTLDVAEVPFQNKRAIYDQTISRKEIDWLPFVITFGMFENFIDVQSELRTSLRYVFDQAPESSKGMRTQLN